MSDSNPMNDSLEKRLEAHYAVAEILSHSVRLQDAAEALLKAIGLKLGWEHGALWQPDKAAGVLKCECSWSVEPDHFAAFETETQRHSFAPNVGLPGRVWASGKPLWLPDVTQEGNFPRMEIACKVNLRAAIAFPLRLNDEVLGVIEFFSRQILKPDENMLQLMTTIGSQIAQFIERKRVEEALRDNENHYRLLTESVSDALFTIDSRSVIVFAASTEKIFGYQPHELVGKKLTELIPETMREAHEAGIKQYQKTGRKNINWRGVELPGLHRSGRLVPLEISFGEYIKDGKPYFTGIARDITRRKEGEDERKLLLVREKAARLDAESARATAESASRMKDEFLATVSHELRTPLTAMLGWARMLRTGILDESKTKHGLEVIERNVRVQAQLVEDLLDVSRIITGKLRLNIQTVDLARVVQAAIDAVRPAADGKKAVIRADLTADIGLITGDPDRLQQIVWNLLSNATRFTPTGGSVDVQLSRSDSAVEIKVTDTGKGISPEFMPFLFKRFRQADSSTTRTYGGLGLGLALVRHLTELHGGSVHAESEGEGKGATFIVKLPIPAVKPALDQMNKSTEPSVSSRTRLLAQSAAMLKDVRVLVVDDDMDARGLVQVVLESSGATVLTTASAAEAMSRIIEFKPHVLISDIGMPIEDGYVFIQQVRALSAAQGGDVPALALTAYARDEDRRKALSAGFQTYLSKPAEPGELVAAVASLHKRC